MERWLAGHCIRAPQRLALQRTSHPPPLLTCVVKKAAQPLKQQLGAEAELNGGGRLGARHQQLAQDGDARLLHARAGVGEACVQGGGLEGDQR